MTTETESKNPRGGGVRDKWRQVNGRARGTSSDVALIFPWVGRPTSPLQHRHFHTGFFDSVAVVIHRNSAQNDRTGRALTGERLAYVSA